MATARSAARPRASCRPLDRAGVVYFETQQSDVGRAVLRRARMVGPSTIVVVEPRAVTCGGSQIHRGASDVRGARRALERDARSCSSRGTAGWRYAFVGVLAPRVWDKRRAMRASDAVLPLRPDQSPEPARRRVDRVGRGRALRARSRCQRGGEWMKGRYRHSPPWAGAVGRGIRSSRMDVRTRGLIDRRRTRAACRRASRYGMGDVSASRVSLYPPIRLDAIGGWSRAWHSTGFRVENSTSAWRVRHVFSAGAPGAPPRGLWGWTFGAPRAATGGRIAVIGRAPVSARAASWTSTGTSRPLGTSAMRALERACGRDSRTREGASGILPDGPGPGSANRLSCARDARVKASRRVSSR